MLSVSMIFKYHATSRGIHPHTVRVFMERKFDAKNLSLKEIPHGSINIHFGEIYLAKLSAKINDTIK